MSSNLTPNNPRDEWLKSLGFNIHVDVLNTFWEKGDFRSKDYIKISPNSATFIYQQMLEARKDELKGLKSRATGPNWFQQFDYDKVYDDMTTRIEKLEAQIAALSKKENSHD